jgi:hypothetical protein
MVALEDRLGLSPRSRRMLGWHVLDGELDVPRERTVIGRKPLGRHR